ncbi:centromere protein Q isoform X2 [Fundulus heteroclitus]|uniref:centromere protein Q isoform X2 n=1 Tax=Fundulus heteroclitus TaxID=8078 RepID=UPI00165C92F8|nr:centromere protein Q isoform X2 [Fundulus heteroclitus]
MKPTRGSARLPTQAPKKKTRKTQEKAAGSATDEDQEPSDKDKTTHSKPPKGRKKAAGGSSSVSKKRKVQGSWGPMPGSTITAVENILDLVILFLGDCVHLKVPLQKQNDLVYSSQHHQEEVKKSEMRKSTLDSLEENLKAVGSKLERAEEQIVSLQQTCSTLRHELEEEEEKAKQILQMRDRGVLKLSSFPSHKEETTLKSRLWKIIPECDCETMARKLGAALQQPASTQEAQDLLLQAQKHADQLFPTLNLCISD